jgi:hypothetical protein
MPRTNLSGVLLRHAILYAWPRSDAANVKAGFGEFLAMLLCLGFFDGMLDAFAVTGGWLSHVLPRGGRGDDLLYCCCVLAAMTSV